MESILLRITGTVQGVGFRPFVHKLARQNKLNGWVRNTGSGVDVFLEGSHFSIERFRRKMLSGTPPHSAINSLEVIPEKSAGLKSFSIKESIPSPRSFPFLPPDISTCDECLRELFNPADRRALYPFINCTNCGPRFTICRDVPYDRPRTTMSAFKMCGDCQREYSDIKSRRYHAQPNACPVCGPEVVLYDRKFCRVAGKHEAFRLAADYLDSGKIVAVKGLGGFHLACDATDESAVSRLKKRKGREDKPMAVMVLSHRDLAGICRIRSMEWEQMQSPARPIVLMEKKTGNPVAEQTAPGHNTFGVMLPYTPLHYLLLNSVSTPALVMTSGNYSDEPLVREDAEALRHLGGIADYFLSHNRKIHARCDDSVIRVINSMPVFLRRSRGFVPEPVKIRGNLQVLACGAELKNTFCLTKNGSAFMSQHIGDLKNAETLAYFRESVKDFCRFFRIRPEVVACDLHPQYLSTKFGKNFPVKKKVEVQHHHAHIASCLADNGLDERVIGFAFDGAGYGSDGTIWGGEILMADLASFERKANFMALPMPGGDAAVLEPWRMALSYLVKSGLENPEKYLPGIGRQQIETGIKMIQTGFNSPLTSSCGRLFDAVAVLTGVCRQATYDGQPAMELEMSAERAKDRTAVTGYGFEITRSAGRCVIDWRHVIREIAGDIGKTEPETIAFRFHAGLAEMLVKISLLLREETGINRVAFSGGVWQNKLMTEMTADKLLRRGFRCFFHRQVPPNDGGIALGQAAVANAVYSRKTHRDDI